MDDYIEQIFCPDIGAMCDTALDCVHCPYRNEELNATIGDDY